MGYSRKQSLLDERAALERRLAEIAGELAKMDGAKPASSAASVSQRDPRQPKPLREVLINMLSSVDYMLTNTIIRNLYEARYQKSLSGSRLGTLSHDESNRKNKWNTTVYGLTHPIQLVNGEIIHVKNVWARSDWPLKRRVYLPITDSLISLHFLEWYFTSLNERGHAYLKSPTMQRYVEGVIDNVEMGEHIKLNMSYINAKKILTSEIERYQFIEQNEYSSLIFKTLAAHRAAKKSFDPDELDGDTDLYA